MHAAYQALDEARRKKRPGAAASHGVFGPAIDPKKDDANRLSLGVYQDFIYP